MIDLNLEDKIGRSSDLGPEVRRSRLEPIQVAMEQSLNRLWARLDDLDEAPDLTERGIVELVQSYCRTAALEGFRAGGSRGQTWTPDASMLSACAKSFRGLIQAELRQRWKTSGSAALQQVHRILPLAAYTHLVRCYEHGSLQGMRDRGVAARSWVTSPDPCSDCASIASIGPVPIDLPFREALSTPPAHPGCRCTVMPSEDHRDRAR
ncbi:MAG: hypothetical protein ACLGH3_10275 [Actinomycetota bacterium]